MRYAVDFTVFPPISLYLRGPDRHFGSVLVRHIAKWANRPAGRAPNSVACSDSCHSRTWGNILRAPRCYSAHGALSARHVCGRGGCTNDHPDRSNHVAGSARRNGCGLQFSRPVLRITLCRTAFCGVPIATWHRIASHRTEAARRSVVRGPKCRSDGASQCCAQSSLPLPGEQGE